MKPSSAKAKGRKLQQDTRDTLLEHAPSLEPDDIRSTSMGAPGEDIQLSPAARKIYPVSVECKNVEKLNIWGALDQASENAGDNYPIVVFKKNGRAPHVAISFEKFMEIYSRSLNNGSGNVEVPAKADSD